MTFRQVFFLLLTLHLLSFNLVANELGVVKYEYGRRESLNDSFLPGNVNAIYKYEYPYGFERGYFPTSDIENREIKKEHAISVLLSVKKNNDYVIATVTIKNNGSKSYYSSPYSLPWYNTNPDGSKTSSICWESFHVTTSNILLHFFGLTCDGGDSNKSEWREIKSQESISFNTTLNDVYELPTDKRIYEITTSNYTLVNDEWFYQRSIKELLFSILNVDSTKICPISQHVVYAHRDERICESYNDNFSGIEEVLYRAGINGESNENEISIRSEPVVIEIDGSKIQSLYERYPYKRKN